MADKPDLVSQSFDSKISAKVHTTTFTTTMSDISVSEKVDLEKFHLRMDVAVDDISHNISGVVMKGNLAMKMILNADTQMVVGDLTMTDSKTKKVLYHNCTLKKVKNMPPAAMLSGFLKTAINMMQNNAKCGGNDGTYDTWKFDKTYDGGVPPIPGQKPLPPGTMVDGSLNEELKMTKDSIIHSSTTSVTLKMTAKDGTVIENVGVDTSMTTSNAKAGGPSDEDMDYTKWSNCKPPAGEKFDIKGFVSQAMPAIPTEAIASQGVFLKHFLAALEKGMKTQEKTVVV